MLDGAAHALERRRTAPLGDRGVIVGAVSWMLMVAMIFTVITRLAMKFVVIKKGWRFGSDDLFIVLAAFFSIGQTSAVSMEVVHALGQHVAEISIHQLEIFQKAEYAGHLLYMANMGCARISVCLLIMKILPGTVAKRAALGFAIVTGLWTISGVLVTAFPCRLPDPWNFLVWETAVEQRRKCINLVKFVNYIGVTNIVVEIVLIIIPLVVWNLRLSAGRSISVSCMFLSRLSVVAAVSAQLCFFNRYVYSKDLTYDYWRAGLCVQLAQNLSIITACLPCLHPFILSILSDNRKAESLRFASHKKLRGYLGKGCTKFDPTVSQSSTMPMRDVRDEKEAFDYCRPLATYGLDRNSTAHATRSSNAHLSSHQHFNNQHFPPRAATPIFGPNPPENVFMRNVEIPSSRPPTSCSQKSFFSRSGSQKEKEKEKAGPVPAIPKSLCEVGVLPIADWDTDSSDRGSDRSRGSRRQRPGDDYVFNRAKVISVPEANALYGQESWKTYPPPPTSGEK